MESSAEFFGLFEDVFREDLRGTGDGGSILGGEIIWVDLLVRKESAGEYGDGIINIGEVSTDDLGVLDVRRLGPVSRREAGGVLRVGICFRLLGGVGKGVETSSSSSEEGDGEVKWVSGE